MSPALLVLVTTLAAGPCPAAPPEAARFGHVVIAPAALPEAWALNHEGARLYREKRFAEARAKYEAASARDSGFTAPLLNVACALVREGRYDDAARTAEALLARAFVPWAREITEATDLAPLRTRAEWPRIERASLAAGERWGAVALTALPFLARTKAPIAVAGAGTSVLGLRQEIVAYVPSSGRYLPLSSEDGRVLAFVVANDRRRLAYLVGSKLVREAGAPPRLRDVAIRQLDLVGMRLSPPVPLGGDVEALTLASDRIGFSLALRKPGGAKDLLRFDGVRLAASPVPHRGGGEVVHVDAAVGVASGPRQARGPCGERIEGVPGAVPGLRVLVSGRPPHDVAAPHGAGLRGLAFPAPRH